MPTTRCSTIVPTACSISSGILASAKHDAKRLVRPIAQSVSPSSNAPASEVIAPPSKAATPGGPPQVQIQTASGYTLSAPEELLCSATSAMPRSACGACTTVASDQFGSTAEMWASRRFAPCRRRLDSYNAVFEHDVMHRVLEPQAGEQSPVHQRPGRSVVVMTMAQQEAGQLLAT